MVRFFAEGKDLHSETARLMFKLPQDVDPRAHLVNGQKARDIAKTINFGLAYGMGAQGLANRVGVDLETARTLMQTYFATYKAVSKYLARSGKEGMARKYTASLSGRRRFFSDEELKARREEAERSAKNHPIQGTNADILKRALALKRRRRCSRQRWCRGAESISRRWRFRSQRCLWRGIGRKGKLWS